MSNILWHSINIQIPDKMLSISKTGRITLKNPLTKTGTIARSNKEPSIIISSSSHIDKPQIISTGDEQDMVELKRQRDKKKNDVRVQKLMLKQREAAIKKRDTKLLTTKERRELALKNYLSKGGHDINDL